MPVAMKILASLVSSLQIANGQLFRALPCFASCDSTCQSTADEIIRGKNQSTADEIIREKKKDTSRRLTTIGLGDEELFAFLSEMENKDGKLAGVVYQGRTIHFKDVLAGSFWEFLAPEFETMAKVFSSFDHHMLLFPLGSNGSVPEEVQTILDMRGASDADHLQIHFQQSGVKGKLLKLPLIADGHSFKFAGPIDPLWVREALVGKTKIPFSTFWWNCQDFATMLFKKVADACTSSNAIKCPPTKLHAQFQWTISPAWCKVVQLSSVISLGIGVAFALVRVCKLSQKHCLCLLSRVQRISQWMSVGLAGKQKIAGGDGSDSPVNANHTGKEELVSSSLPFKIPI